MGLTGIIIDATFELIPIETSRMSVETRRVGHLDEIMARMAESDADVRYSVAWIDLLASGQAPRPWRAHQRRARHLRRTRPGRRFRSARATRPTTRRGAPRGAGARRDQPALGDRLQRAVVPQGARSNGRASCSRSRPTSTRSTSSGAGIVSTAGTGFLQYQFVVPFGAEAVLRTVIERISAAAPADLPDRAQAVRRRQPRSRSASRSAAGRWRST